MKRRSALLAALALLVVGVLVGGLAVHLVHSGQWQRPSGRGNRFMERMDRHLSLTPEQRDTFSGFRTCPR